MTRLITTWVFVTAFLFANIAAAGLPPTSTKSQLDTSKSTTFDFQAPFNQFTKPNGTTALIETGNKNLLKDPGFESSDPTAVWVIALAGTEFAGFCYIESWGNKEYVANSGLIVVEKFRGHGLAKRIKNAAFTLSRLRWPKAKLFGLTSGAAVMKINTELGYVPVTFSELTNDEAFWKGCEGCINHDVLTRTERRYCICTAMLYDPNSPKNKKNEEKDNK